jgi:hypothetical protein
MRIRITVAFAICCLLVGCGMHTKVDNRGGITYIQTYKKIQPAISTQASQQGDVSGGKADTGDGIAGIGESGSTIGGAEISDASGKAIRYNAK